jgi:predicted amidohydrolase YtcJ
VNQINASQLERMRKLGMYAAVHPWAVINGGIMHDSFGDCAYDMPPLTTIQNSGVTWGLGTDATAANQYLPFTTLAFAVTGKMAGGARTVIHQTVSREDASLRTRGRMPTSSSRRTISGRSSQASSLTWRSSIVITSRYRRTRSRTFHPS